MVLKMKTKCKFIFIGICCVLLSYTFAQQNIPNGWCDGITAKTYIRNVTDCTRWIRCNGLNTPTTGFCPNPSYFSVELQKCTTKNAAKCFACPNPTSITFEAVENSCKRFIRCVDGVPTEFMCGVGMVFNSDTKRCESELNQACSISSTPTSGSAPSTSKDVDASGTTVTSSTIIVYNTTEF